MRSFSSFRACFPRSHVLFYRRISVKSGKKWRGFGMSGFLNATVNSPTPLFVCQDQVTVRSTRVTTGETEDSGTRVVILVLNKGACSLARGKQMPSECLEPTGDGKCHAVQVTQAQRPLVPFPW